QIVMPAVVCAAKPAGGSMLYSRWPSVRMIRQPPTYVPAAIARPDATITQVGMWSNCAWWPLVTSARVITPIVFCASFAPWLNATHVPDTSWPSRKPRLATPGVSQAKTQKIASSRRNAPTNASAGATTAGITTRWASPCQSTPLDPDWTSAAPTRPPINACDELDGSPNHQVRRFQTIAPTSAASTVFVVASPLSMIPLPTVFATAVVANAPARLAAEAISTASRGDNARVETDVATAFAVSWKPFVKSKPSATTTTTTSRTSFNGS